MVVAVVVAAAAVVVVVFRVVRVVRVGLFFLGPLKAFLVYTLLSVYLCLSLGPSPSPTIGPEAIHPKP